MRGGVGVGGTTHIVCIRTSVPTYLLSYLGVSPCIDEGSEVRGRSICSGDANRSANGSTSSGITDGSYGVERSDKQG